MVERDITIEGSNKNKSSDSGSDVNTLTHGLTVTTDGSDTESGSVEHTHNQDETTNFDKINVEDSLQIKHEEELNQSGSVDHHHSQAEANNFDSTASTNKVNVDHSSSTGKTTVEPGAHQITETTLKQGSVDNTVTFDKNNPQSISYEASDLSGGFADHVPNPNWQYATDQAQAVNKHTILGEDPDKVDVYQTGQAVTSNESSSDHNSDESGTSKTNFARDETTTDTYNDVKTNKNYTDTHSGGTNTTHNIRRDETTTDTYNNLKTQHNNTVKNTGDDVTTLAHGKITDVEGSNNSEDSGRTGMRTIGSSMRSAVSFIEGTSAWEWLSDRLEVCFLGVYDI